MQRQVEQAIRHIEQELQEIKDMIQQVCKPVREEQETVVDVITREAIVADIPVTARTVKRSTPGLRNTTHSHLIEAWWRAEHGGEQSRTG